MDDATKCAERTLLVLSAASLVSDEILAQQAVAFVFGEKMPTTFLIYYALAGLFLILVSAAFK
jgi:hypothetical protein